MLFSDRILIFIRYNLDTAGDEKQELPWKGPSKMPIHRDTSIETLPWPEQDEQLNELNVSFTHIRGVL